MSRGNSKLRINEPHLPGGNVNLKKNKILLIDNQAQ